MKMPKLVVGYLIDDELLVKSVPIPKPHDWVKWLPVEDLVVFFQELFQVITRISEGKENSETLRTFLDRWCEAASESEHYAAIWESLPPSLQRTLLNPERDVLGDIAETELELDAPWIDIIEGQPDQRSATRNPYAEPEMIDVTEQERDHYLAQPIFDLELSARAHNCLKNENIKAVRELVAKMEWDLLEYQGLGQATLHEIKSKLAGLGLYLGMDLFDEDDKEASF